MRLIHIVLALVISIVSFTAIADNHSIAFNPNLHEKIAGKYAIKNQLLIAIPPHIDTTDFLQHVSQALVGKKIKLLNTEVISSKKSKIAIIKINFNNQQSLSDVIQLIKDMPNVEWVQPNYIYNIGFDPREITPNDPLFTDQYFHPLMMNDKAWDITTGNNILIAITDDGFDINHEDLSSRFQANQGYNFCDNNADVTASEPNGLHGTHVAGIAAAESNNGKGGAGVAGGANILPIKFYSNTCNWTSDLIYQAYKYAVDKGANIISTSYSIDVFVGDNTFIAALDYAYTQGVLQFNSAGNNHEKDPLREAFQELILVASTDEHDRKSDYSNYGKQIQIAAPGENILSTIPNNQYNYLSGTSMATPNAAGAGALIWAAHPTWNRDQVAAQLIGTADNIDAKNPTYKTMLGAGRVNSYRALTEQVAPPKVLEVIVNRTPIDHSKMKAVTLAIHFDKLLNPDVVNNGTYWQIKFLGDFSLIPATMMHPWYIGTMLLELQLPDLKPGSYQLTISAGLKDPFGQALDGKGNGSPAGSDYIYNFYI